MALKLKIDIKTLPPAARIVLTILPSVIITAIVVIFLILPKDKEIRRLNAEITKQENEIAKDQAKAAKLDILKKENERLRMRLDELKLQLPEEREISGLLKQVSDLGIRSGLKIILWKPEQKKDHPSGIIYEIPVNVELSGSYHNLGIFFSSLTKLNRIVNIGDIKLTDPKPQKNEAILKITFKATTFSSIPEKEIQAKATEATKGKKK
ncbi:MAG: type 4a pilus biogenesis protein PilO [Thermodesulfovibrionales bacterium]